MGPAESSEPPVASHDTLGKSRRVENAQGDWPKEQGGTFPLGSLGFG